LRLLRPLFGVSSQHVKRNANNFPLEQSDHIVASFHKTKGIKGCLAESTPQQVKSRQGDYVNDSAIIAFNFIHPIYNTKRKPLQLPNSLIPEQKGSPQSQLIDRGCEIH
jgi:hypothetical protein